jgi:hypothetical protein
MIDVRKIDEQTFEVAVEGHTKTIHRVTVTPQTYQKLTGGEFPIETLIEKSFEFLLEREPNTSILRSFDLPVIGRYFPDYEQTIRGMLE